MIKRMGHVALKVENMDASLQFYCDVLGMEPAFDLKDDEGQPWIKYIKIAPGQFIELFYGGKNKPEPVTEAIGVDHLCLEVEDIYTLAGHLRANGITLDAEPAWAKDRNLQCWARDPGGNRIEFMQLVPGSPKMNT